MTYNRNQRTAWGRGLAVFFHGGWGRRWSRKPTGRTVWSFLPNSCFKFPNGALPLWISNDVLRNSHSCQTSRKNGPADRLNPFRWRKMSFTKSTTWEPEIGLFSYINSPFLFQCIPIFFNLIQQLSSLSFVELGYTFHHLFFNYSRNSIFFFSGFFTTFFTLFGLRSF